MWEVIYTKILLPSRRHLLPACLLSWGLALAGAWHGSAALPVNGAQLFCTVTCPVPLFFLPQQLKVQIDFATKLQFQLSDGL